MAVLSDPTLEPRSARSPLGFAPGALPYRVRCQGHISAGLDLRHAATTSRDPSHVSPFPGAPCAVYRRAFDAPEHRRSTGSEGTTRATSYDRATRARKHHLSHVQRARHLGTGDPGPPDARDGTTLRDPSPRDPRRSRWT